MSYMYMDLDNFYRTLLLGYLSSSMTILAIFYNSAAWIILRLQELIEELIDRFQGLINRYSMSPSDCPSQIVSNLMNASPPTILAGSF